MQATIIDLDQTGDQLIYLIASYHFERMFNQQRKKLSFNQLELSHLAYGGKAKWEAFQKMQEICSTDPEIKYDPTFLHQSRADMMTAYAKKVLAFHKYYALDGSNEVMKLTLFTHATPLSLHGLMYMTTLRNLCDEEQQKMFLEPSLRGEMTGCYAQTELAHGSDVQNLLTTATYDSSTQSFIIHTPSIGAAKWWIGDLGIYCNHAVVFAQLIINQKKYGVHAFIIPIRDPKTLTTLKGVEAGDIGPKITFQNKDNGYAIFTNVRIPRRNMLMKYHVVSKEGVYSLQGNQKISYATMLLTRAGIISALAKSSAKLVTIATRYSIVRKQFKNNKGEQVPVFNYQTQQEKIIPRIAEAYAATFIESNILGLGQNVFQQSKKGNFKRLNEAHVITSGIKAVLSYEVLRGAQILRRSAGGHGFHAYNGMVAMITQNTSTFTLEGQFTVLLLQVSRYLLKALSNLSKGKPLDETVRYLEQIKTGLLNVQIDSQSSVNCPHLVNRILMLHSCAKLMAVSEKFSKLMSEAKLTPKQIEDHHAGILLNDAAMAHCYFLLYSNFLKVTQSISDQNLKAVMAKLVLLYGIEKIIQRSGKIYETSTITPEAFGFLYRKRESLLEDLRPQALSLVEAFGYSDSSLMTAIGSSDGRPYQNLIEWAQKYNTINRKEQRDQIVQAIKKAKSELRPRI